TNGAVILGWPNGGGSNTRAGPASDVRATVSVRQGASVSVFVARDLDFSTVGNAPLEPSTAFLERPDVTDITVNRPGEVWIETSGGALERHDVATSTTPVSARLARQIAAWSHQGVSREHPSLAATMPDGSRIQIVSPPATRGTIALAIRKHVSADSSLDDYAASGAFMATQRADARSPQADATPSTTSQPDPTASSRRAVSERRNISISGGTSTGKTTFLNALSREVPASERSIAIEDTPESVLTQPNSSGSSAARNASREAAVTTDDSLNAASRMRPDRIIVGESRGGEAYTFSRTVNTGHPGSMRTIHADSPEGAVN
ncbi:hypothetical protein OY671_008061, partial [Metschnikowia pulcherrima]